MKESSGSFSMEFRLNSQASQDVTIMITIMDIGNNSNVFTLCYQSAIPFIYLAGLLRDSSSLASSSVTIPSGGLFVSYSVDIIDDTVQEENETFSLTVDLQPSCLPVSINGDQSFTITIIDDEGNDISVCCMCCYVGLL